MTKQPQIQAESGEQVIVWTPWGAQSVPHADSKLTSVRRLVRKARAKAAASRKEPRKRLLDA